MGAGKTTLLGEASDILALRHIAHAAIDLDALGLVHLPSAPSNDGVMYRNLQSVCNNYSSLGVRRLLLARAMEDRAELELCRRVVFSQKHSRLPSHCQHRSDAAARPDARIRCVAAQIRCSRRETERHP